MQENMEFPLGTVIHILWERLKNNKFWKEVLMAIWGTVNLAFPEAWNFVYQTLKMICARTENIRYYSDHDQLNTVRGKNSEREKISFVMNR